MLARFGNRPSPSCSSLLQQPSCYEAARTPAALPPSHGTKPHASVGASDTLNCCSWGAG